MTNVQKQAVVAITDTLVTLIETESDELRKATLNGVLFLHVQLAKNLTDHEKLTIQA